MTLGEKIRAQRKVLRLTQAELAEKVGVSRRVIISYETNKTQPRTETGLLELARALHVSLDYLTSDNSKPVHDSSDFSELLNELLDEFLSAENNYSFDELNRWQRIFQYLLDNCLTLSNNDKLIIMVCLCDILCCVGNYPEAMKECESAYEELLQAQPNAYEIASEITSSTSSFSSTIDVSANPNRIAISHQNQAALFLFVHLLFSNINIAIKLEDIEKAQTRLKEADDIIRLIKALPDETARKKADKLQIALYSKMASICRKKKDYNRGKAYAIVAIKYQLSFDNPGKVVFDPMIDYIDLDQTSELAEYFSVLGYVLLGEETDKLPNEKQIPNLEEAVKNLQIGLDIRKRISINHPKLASSYHNIGRAYLELLQLVTSDDENYEFYKGNAEANMLLALRIKKSDTYPNEDGLALEYRNLGLLYKYIGKSEDDVEILKQSKYYFDLCLKIRADIYPADHDKIKDLKAQLEELNELESSIDSY